MIHVVATSCSRMSSFDCHHGKTEVVCSLKLLQDGCKHANDTGRQHLHYHWTCLGFGLVERRFLTDVSGPTAGDHWFNTERSYCDTRIIIVDACCSRASLRITASGRILQEDEDRESTPFIRVLPKAMVVLLYLPSKAQI